MVVDDNEITCVTPAGQGVVDVTVTTPGGTSFPVPFYYILPPHISDLRPTAGPVAGGTTVTIDGRNLQTATAVTLGPATLLPTALSDSQLTVTTPPAAAGTVPVVVTTIGGVADDATFTFLDPRPPRVSSPPPARRPEAPPSPSAGPALPRRPPSPSAPPPPPSSSSPTPWSTPAPRRTPRAPST